MALEHKYRTIFTNTDQVMELLKEIGSYEYYKQLELKNLIDQKPMLRKGFFLESKMDGIHLCYRYPLVECSIMVVDHHYQNLPLKGWELLKNSDY